MLGSSLVAAQLALIVVLLSRSSAIWQNPVSLIGLFVAGIWLCWAVWSMPRKTLKVHPSPAKAGNLCQGRAYRVVRHPMYGAVLLGSMMVAFADGSWLTALVWLALLAVLWAKSSLEEKWLSQRFEEYQQYRTRTPRWIPLGPVSEGSLPLRGTGYLVQVLALTAVAYLFWQSFESGWDHELFGAENRSNLGASAVVQLLESSGFFYLAKPQPGASVVKGRFIKKGLRGFCCIRMGARYSSVCMVTQPCKQMSVSWHCFTKSLCFYNRISRLALVFFLD